VCSSDLKDGRFLSAEEQTPIFPFLYKQIRQSGLDQGRIIIQRGDKDLYVGSIFKLFLEKEGITVNGDILSGSGDPGSNRLIFTFESPYTLKDVIRKLLEFSNNYIANQLIITIGAKVFGVPGNLAKGTKAIRQFTEKDLGIIDYSLVEGSGVSRNNRISANAMSALLDRFFDYRFLMRSRNNVLFKTGTLNGISTRVGYLTSSNNEIYSFVIFCNTPGKSAEKIERMLYSLLSSRRDYSSTP
jgi:D-alanyl-D-alanine carboxypeptidase/D-alanyl-D-alanine-endopeptidase (penicillin-binding protein 4)